MSKQPLRILIAEDSADDAELMLRELRRAGFEPEWKRVQSEAEFLELLHPELDIILSDYEMPQFDGPRALELLKERKLDIPFIILSGTIGEDVAVTVMKQGAADYLLKDRLGRLGPAVSHALEQSRLRRERKQAEEELRLFRTLIDHSADTFEVIDPETGRILDVNEKSCIDLGYTRAEYLALRVFDMDPTLTEETWPETVEKIHSVGSWSSESVRKRKDGTTFPIEFNAKWVGLERSYIVTVLRDVTERKKAEAQLRLLETCISRLNDIVVITEAEPQDEPGPRIVFVNDAFVHRTGYSREEALGRSPRFLQGPKTSRVQLDRIHVAMKQWKPVRVEVINYTKSGEEFWLDLDIVPVADAKGWFTHWVAVERDITERRRTEERMRRLVDSNAQGVMFWKLDGSITGANAAFLDLVGYSREDLDAGRLNWAAMTPPEYAEKDRQALAEIAAKSTCAPFEKQYFRKDGSRVSVLIGAASFENTPGEGVGFAVDLTERIKLENQFLRAQRMESIGTLAGGIAHDLNNILAPIMMSATVLRGNLTAELRESIISTIEMSAERGAQIIKQVLTFGRGAEGEKRPLQLASVIEEVMKIMRGTFPKDIIITSVVSPSLWPMLGDATQLHQVLLNLCVNARDAMPRGGMLRLQASNLDLDASYASMFPEAAPGPHIYLEVSDTGEGIPPEVVERIFDPFFTTKGVGKGTGLGLSTVLGIIKSHRGFIRVKTAPGAGTTFQIHLPASPSQETAPVNRVTPLKRKGLGELVLVVDDEECVRNSARLTLEAGGYDVLVAADGTAALAEYAMNTRRIAAVITDIMMPVMDGVALIRALRTISPTLPIIASTGLIEKGQMAELKELHVETILDKPYSGTTLLDAVHGALHVAAPL